MSVENRPNLHAVGLLTDVFNAIENRIRGDAGEAGMKVVMPLIADDVRQFVERIDETLDERFPAPAIDRSS